MIPKIPDHYLFQVILVAVPKLPEIPLPRHPPPEHSHLMMIPKLPDHYVIQVLLVVVRQRDDTNDLVS